MTQTFLSRARNPVAAVAATLLSCTAVAVDTTMTQGGFTGLSITPNAHLLGWGRAAFTYDNQLPGAIPQTGDNYVLGIGLLPNVELSGRIAANKNPDNCFTSPCVGIRDLAASGKIGIGLDAAGRFRIAAGASDVGGAATNFRTYYGVLTYSEGPYEGSVGLARRSNVGTNRSPLHGPFASAAWQPLPWVRGHVEYTDRNAWAGVRLFAPGEWLPEGWSAHVGANARLTDTNLTRRSWITAGVSIPLYKVPTLPGQGPRAPLPALSGTQQPLPAYEARAVPLSPANGPSTSVPVPVPGSTPPPGGDRLQSLAIALKERGFEDIWIGRMADASIAVRVNNATYNWNSVDALGAALGAVARELGDGRTGYRLILTQRQIPLVAVTGQTDCLRQWIQEANPGCAAGELSTPGTLPLDTLHAGSDWVVRDLQPSWKTVRVGLTPVLRTTVATEVGVLDYSAGLNVGAAWPLWDGAVAEWRVQKEVVRSEDFDRGGIYTRNRIRGGTERLAITQTMRLPMESWLAPGDELTARRWGLASVTAQATVGRFGNHFDGVHGAMRWEPGEGRHRVTLQGGVFRNSEFGAVPGEPRRATPLLGTYRYTITPTRTYLEGTAGQFMNNDRGAQFGLRQWFGDVAIQAYVRRTKFSSSAARTFAGLEFSVPLGLRRDMDPAGIQFTGTPRFSHRIQTVVGGGTNAVIFGTGELPPVPSIDALHNSDRAGLVYFEDNLRRLRDAAR